MKYRLSIDSGTASVGITTIELDESMNPKSAPYHQVRIFSEPLLPGDGVGTPKKAERREARLRRKQNWRKKHELRYLETLYSPIDLTDKDVLNVEGDVTLLRAKAASDRIELPELMRVFKKMRKRRGYKGRFRERKNQKKGLVQSGIETIESAMQENGCKTLGQYLAFRHENGQSLKLKRDGLYVHRQMVENEFEDIWTEQSKHHSILSTSYNGSLFKECFRQAIFRQLPLKSPAPMVGRCPFEPTLPRAPKAQMAVQRYIIAKQIADLAWGNGRHSQPLNNRQRELIAGLLNECDFVGFDDLYGLLTEQGNPPSAGECLNLDTRHRKGLKGNSTIAAMEELGLKHEWLALPEKIQDQIINFLADLGSPDLLEEDGWYENIKTSAGTHRKLFDNTVDFINRMVACESFGRLNAMGFDTGRSAYSLKAIRKLLPMLEQGMNEREAQEKIYPEAFAIEGQEIQQRLPHHASTGNAVVDVALRQIRREVTQAVESMGCLPEEVVIEMSRDMALGQKKREEKANAIGKIERARRAAAKVLKDNGFPSVSGNVMRYLLWEEQDKRFCPFCDKAIGLSDAMDGHITNIEHIIPFRLTRVGKQRGKLVLAHRSCNDAKGDRTPWQAWGGDDDRWAIIEGHAHLLEKNGCKGKARQILMQDFEDEVLNDESILGFSERQFIESSWIAKLAAQWMKQICPRVFVSRGELTAYLRRIWGLDTVISQVRFEERLPVLDTDGEEVTQEDFELHRREWEGKKPTDGGMSTKRRLEKRIDHRHHLIDALVIGMCTPGFFQKMARHYKAEAELVAEGKRVKMKLRPDPPLDNIREIALGLVRECRVSHKPDRYPDSRLFEETAYKLVPINGKPQLASKTDLKKLVSGNKTHAQIRKKLETIASPATREIVQKVFEERIKKGYKLAAVFDEPISDPRYPGAFIRRVDMTYDGGMYATIDVSDPKQTVLIPAESEDEAQFDNRFKKRLVHDGYACLEFNPETEDVRLLSPVQALRSKGKQVESGYIRLFKGDSILHPNRNCYVVRQIKSQAGGLIVATLSSETRPVKELDTRSGLKTISGGGLFKLRLVRE